MVNWGENRIRSEAYEKQWEERMQKWDDIENAKQEQLIQQFEQSKILEEMLEEKLQIDKYYLEQSEENILIDFKNYVYLNRDEEVYKTVYTDVNTLKPFYKVIYLAMLKYEFPKLYKMKCELMSLYAECSLYSEDWIGEFRLSLQQFLFKIREI